MDNSAVGTSAQDWSVFVHRVHTDGRYIANASSKKWSVKGLLINMEEITMKHLTHNAEK